MRKEEDVRPGREKPRKNVKNIDHTEIKKVLDERFADKLEEVREEKRTSKRIANRFKPDMKPVLTFTSIYKGTRTQKWDEVQEIGFQQAAQLEWNAMAPNNIDTYFEFRQYVYDKTQWAGHEPEVRDWQLDGPYKPPYKNAQTQAGKTSITFTDEPGFSSTGRSADNRKVAAGDWLQLYTVSFYWEVTRIATGQVWRSDVVTHTMMSTPNIDDSDAAVNAVAAGNKRWEIDLPPG